MRRMCVYWHRILKYDDGLANNIHRAREEVVHISAPLSSPARVTSYVYFHPSGLGWFSRVLWQGGGETFTNEAARPRTFVSFDCTCEF